MAHTIGIRREDKSIWERRAALTPENVAELVSKHGMRVLVQPSDRRVFKDIEYEEAGAVVTDDLREASAIFCVKEVPPSELIPEKTFVFFSHTIKAQPYNMPLLDRLLSDRIRLIDYECITRSGRRGDSRLVAFGRFAGVAGAVDMLRGLGERFLNLGYSTPLLNVAATYMYPNEAAWRAAVTACGVRISQIGLPDHMCPFICAVTGRGNVSKGTQEILKLLPHTVVTPDELPAVMASTGKKRTHQIYVCEVAWDHMVRRRAGAPPPPLDATTAAASGASASGAAGSGLSAASDPLASRAEYHAHPDRYENAFQDTVAPYASTIFVCHYWENRFPRVLTIKQAQQLRASGRLRLQGVCDISCDMRGAVEFLSRFTSIEHPYYVWDPEADVARTAPGFMGESGILFHAVDHLPSECPLEASQHFGNCLMPFVPAIAASSPLAPMKDLGPALRELSQSSVPPVTGPPPFLPAPIRGAVVTNAGTMAPQFEYILKLRAAQEAAASKRLVRLRRRESFVTLHLRGHLFDSGAINRVLDAVEAVEGASCVLQAVTVGASGDDKSEASMSLFASEAGELSTAVKAVVEAATALDTQVDVAGSDDTPVSPTSSLATAAASSTGFVAQTGLDATAAASASIGMPRSGSGSVGGGGGSIEDTVALAARSSTPKLSQLTRFDDTESTADPLADLASGLRSAPPKCVLLLGAGMVTRPLVRYLLRRPNNTITVCSALPGEAEKLCSGRARASPKHMAISLTPETDQPELGGLVASHDLVISMLPAFLHVGVARLCVAAGRHMVTASYISPAMQALNDEATAANVLLLNEMGVDPGFDHMSAMRMISEAKAAGEIITGFESSTGGLPAPEVATNPLGYRFSWSPRGALVAARNAARFIRDGGLVDVVATDLLASAEPYTAGRGFALEVLPNRDSTSYAPKYGLGTAKADGGELEHLFRGTLRYRGFSRQLLALASLGLLDAVPCGEGHDAVLDQAADDTATASSVPTMRDWLASRCEVDASSVTDVDLVAAVCQRANAVLKAAGRTELNEEERAVIGEMLGFSGLLGTGAVPSLEAGKRTAVDALAVVLGALPEMQYAAGQRDMVVMQHRVHSRNATGQKLERSALLVEYERGGESAMARTVGLTAAISAQLVLDGAIKMRGVRAPVHAEIYEPVLDALEGEGISMQEKQRILA